MKEQKELLQLLKKSLEDKKQQRIDRSKDISSLIGNAGEELYKYTSTARNAISALMELERLNVEIKQLEQIVITLECIVK